MISFYQPTDNRYKIIVETGAFPSDQYAIESQIKFHGFDPKSSLIELSPRKSEKTLRTEDILDAVSEFNEEISTIILGGVNYYTGQAFDMKSITEAGGIICPATPSFYSNPETFEELASTVIDRVLTLAKLEHDSYSWNEQ